MYNFDEICLLFRLLATVGNVCGTTKGRKGGKRPKDRLTDGLFWNADGSDFWKPIMIGKAKKPRYFGNHWNPGKNAMLYYSNESAWMKESIRSDALRHFNSYCYEKRPVVLLVDNCPAHKPLIGSKPWSSGHMKGYELSNVLVIFFEPNCTSHVCTTIGRRHDSDSESPIPKAANYLGFEANCEHS